MTRVTLDSNVYISALVFGGKPKRLLGLAAEGVIISSVSGPILEEVERVLLTKFLWSDDRVQEALSTIRAITEYVRRPRRWRSSRRTLTTTASWRQPSRARRRSS